MPKLTIAWCSGPLKSRDLRAGLSMKAHQRKLDDLLRHQLKGLHVLERSGLSLGPEGFER